MTAPEAPAPATGAGSGAATGTEVFEYALIRLVPRIELDEDRLRALDPGVDAGAVRAALGAFTKACTEGPLAGRPLGERFRWLTAPRSTIVQPGPVHTGLTADPAAELDHLFDTLVRR